MADFDTDWKITGSPDPATPDPQPHQVQAQPQPQQSYQAPVQQASQTVPGLVPAPVQQQPVAQPQFIGYNVNGPVYRNANGFVAPAPTVDHTEEREANLLEIGKMINHFSPKADLYQEYEKCQKDIDKYARTSVAPFVWGILLILHCFVSTFIAATSKAKNNILIYSCVAAGFLLLGAGSLALYFIKKKRHEKKLEELLARFGELSSQLKIIYNGYSSCVLPPEYTDPRLLYQFQSMIYHGRVFSIGSALNTLLAVPGVYQRVINAKQKFETESSEMLNGTAAFFNAYKYFRFR